MIAFFFVGDHDRVIDEYERAISLYSDTDNEIFQKYLEEVETGIAVLKEELSRKLREDDMPLDLRKRLIANLVRIFGLNIFVKLQATVTESCNLTENSHHF